MNSACACGTIAFPAPLRRPVRTEAACALMAASPYAAARHAKMNDNSCRVVGGCLGCCPWDFRSHGERTIPPSRRTLRTARSIVSALFFLLLRQSVVPSHAASTSSMKLSKISGEGNSRRIPTAGLSPPCCVRTLSRTIRRT